MRVREIFMKINILSSKHIQRPVKTARSALTALMFCLPAKTGTDIFVKNILPHSDAVEIISKTNGLNYLKNIATKFEIVADTNCRGGITKGFASEDITFLKNKMQKLKLETKYIPPIDTGIRPYIPSTGQFGSIRPQNRPHLGIDIYPKLYGRKPQEPVYITSATDGIVVSAKKSPAHDPQNLIANNIKILAPDGKMYSYDHMARPEDYTGTKYFDLKSPGEIVRAGDTIGIVGRSGETVVWHLHFAVTDPNALQKQLKNPVWKNLYKKHGVYATPRGQVDPLNRKKAGNIADILKQYHIDSGKKVDYWKQL